MTIKDFVIFLAVWILGQFIGIFVYEMYESYGFLTACVTFLIGTAILIGLGMFLVAVL